MQISRVLSSRALDIHPNAAHAVYSVNIASAQAENRKILVSSAIQQRAALGNLALNYTQHGQHDCV